MRPGLRAQSREKAGSEDRPVQLLRLRWSQWDSNFSPLGFRMSAHAHVVGWGKYVPRRLLTNDELSRMVDTSDQWIRERTGIQERHLIEDGETTSSMATLAARKALETAR